MTRIEGTSGDDFLAASAEDDVIEGGEGNDLIQERGGNDVLNGDANDDALRGNAGDNQLFSGTGNDNLRAGSASEAHKCRNLALRYSGRPEQRLLINLAAAFEEIARDGMATIDLAKGRKT